MKAMLCMVIACFMIGSCNHMTPSIHPEKRESTSDSSAFVKQVTLLVVVTSASGKQIIIRKIINPASGPRIGYPVVEYDNGSAEAFYDTPFRFVTKLFISYKNGNKMIDTVITSRDAGQNAGDQVNRYTGQKIFQKRK